MSECNTITTNATTAIVPIDPEVERLTKPQENLPAACEASERVCRLRQESRTLTKFQSIGRLLLCCILTIILIISIVSVVCGDLSKVETATRAVQLLAQALAITTNGTSSSSPVNEV
jgi:hypothetical protein